jgi:hypothetical protein
MPPGRIHVIRNSPDAAGNLHRAGAREIRKIKFVCSWFGRVL